MLIIVLLSVLLVICIAVIIICGIVRANCWFFPSQAHEVSCFLQMIFGLIGLIVLVIEITLGIIMICANTQTKVNAANIWYEETVESLNSTKEYISTITDDYARSVAVTNYNSKVNSFRLTIKTQKNLLENPWINWLHNKAYKGMDEYIIDYIK